MNNTTEKRMYKPWKQFRFPEEGTPCIIAHRQLGYDSMSYLQCVTLKNRYEDEGQKTWNVYSTHPDTEGSYIGTLQCFQKKRVDFPYLETSLSFRYTEYYGEEGSVPFGEVTLHYTMEE